jgi:hypothetical protein
LNAGNAGFADERTLATHGPSPILATNRSRQGRSTSFQTPPSSNADMMERLEGAIIMTASIYDIPVRTISGADTSLSEFKGKVLLVVNVASKC